MEQNGKLSINTLCKYWNLQEISLVQELHCPFLLCGEKIDIAFMSAC